ncbi:putative OB-fold protein [Pseudonocardia kunmingensis]|uniref:Putative OB-fold protein n=1 Tax=Pseudonocardia kunmingensis TaxID=630975 RepID=A0A543DPJ0_9PSEU|nr:putative OB-fold protein [Pseudonocardia kunmingensis]
MDRVPLVDYLVLGDEPHLVAQECTTCGARYFDRRSACASCGLQEFHAVDIPTTGTLRSFTIVHSAAAGVQVPFVAGIVDCDGTSVKGNVVNTPPDPEHVNLGMPVRLTTMSIGVDAAGVEAVGYGFEPAN